MVDDIVVVDRVSVVVVVVVLGSLRRRNGQ